MDWECVWSNIKLFINNIIDWTDLHYGFLIVILTMITAIALILYTSSTWKMSRTTNKSVMVAEKSIRITKEKERIDRTIDFIDRFQRKGYKESISGSISFLSQKSGELHEEGLRLDPIRDFEVNWRMNNILLFFNLLAYLIKEDKVDYYIIKDYLGEELVDFTWNHQSEIEQLIKYNKHYNRHRNYRDYFNLCAKIEDEIKSIVNSGNFIEDLKKGFETSKS